MLYNVQVLRAVAAYLVVMVHLEALLALAGASGWISVAGNAGVDLFFVISGYLMVYTTARRPMTPMQFMLNRIVRIVPMYWLCTLGVFAIALAEPSLLISTGSSVSDLAKSLFFVPFAKANGVVQPLLFLGWTLNYEMFFYLVFALSLNLPRPYRVAAVVAVLLGLWACGEIVRPRNLYARFYLDPIVIEFAMGMVLAWGLERAVAPRSWIAWSAILVGGVVLLGRFSVLPLAERGWWSGIPATMILGGAVLLERAGLTWRNRIVQLLGAASFSLYLIHPFVTQAVTRIMTERGVAYPQIAVASGILVALVLVGLAAIGVHWTIERPMTNALRRFSGRPASVVQREEDAIVAPVA